jgi:hypothetical protein
MPQLPPELIDRIIDHLHDSPTDLCRCALVCWAWVAPSRFHLLYSISVDLRGQNLYPQKFKLLKAIQHSPGMGVHVSELILIAVDIHRSEDLKKLFPQILGSLTRLRKLVLVDVNWVALESDIAELVLYILALPSLVDLEIVGTFFPTSDHFMNMFCTHLKRLEVDIPMWISKEEQEMAAVVPARQPCHLEHLVLCLRPESIDILDWLVYQSTIDISNLRTLVMDFLTSRQRDLVMKFIRNLPPSLEHFVIQHSGM